MTRIVNLLIATGLIFLGFIGLTVFNFARAASELSSAQPVQALVLNTTAADPIEAPLQDIEVEPLEISEPPVAAAPVDEEIPAEPEAPAEESFAYERHTVGISDEEWVAASQMLVAGDGLNFRVIARCSCAALLRGYEVPMSIFGPINYYVKVHYGTWQKALDTYQARGNW